MLQDTQRAYKRNTEAFSRNRCWCGKTISIIYSECVCSVSYPACKTLAPYFYLWPVRLYRIFPHYFINSTTNGKKLLKKTCFDFLCNFFFVGNISYCKKNSARYFYKCTLVFMQSAPCCCQSWRKLNFIDKFSKNTLPDFMKICPMGAKLFRADGQTGWSW